MNPNDHPDQATPPGKNTADPSTEEWFNSIQSPAQLPQPSDDTPRRSNTWKFVLAGILAFTLIALGVVVYVTRSVQETPVTAATCLNNASFKEFTGVSTEAKISAGDSFYTDSVNFINGTSSYTKDSAAATTELLTKIGTFYKKHSTDSSIIVTVSSDYIEGKTADLSKKRLEKLKQSLLESGVAASAIVVKAPKPISVEPDYAVEEGPTLISIGSDSQCKQ